MILNSDPSEGQDADPRHLPIRGREDAGSNRGMPAFAAVGRGIDRSQRRSVSRSDGTERSRRRGGGREKKKACAEEFARAIEAEVERLVGPGSADTLDLEALETGLRRRMLEFGAQLAAQRINEDHTDQAGPRLACACGGCRSEALLRPGRSAVSQLYLHQDAFATTVSCLGLCRAWWSWTTVGAYYGMHCGGCGEGFFPRDRSLGVEGASLSPGVVRMVGTAAARVSFAESSELLAELAGLRIDPQVRQAELDCAPRGTLTGPSWEARSRQEDE